MTSETAHVLKICFTVPAGLTEDEIHEIGERIVTGLFTDEPVAFERTEVVDES